MREAEEGLVAYLKRNKFSDPEVWRRRGLNPSPQNVVALMERVVNEVCSSALQALQANHPPGKVKATLIAALHRYRAGDFDTEDREFIASEVNDIAKKVGIDVRRELTAWLYGPILGFIINLTRN